MTLAHDVAEPADRPARDTPVLLLHSTLADRRMWDHQVRSLTAAGYRVIRCDLSGYGQSPAPTGPYNDAEDVRGLLDALGAERVDMVGASGGGLVATEVAARWPHRVARLVLIATAAAGHEPGPELAAFVVAEDELLEAGRIDEAVELNLRTWLQTDVPQPARELVWQMQRRAFELQQAMDDVPELAAEVDPARITAPTLLISGARDFADFRRIAERLATRIPSAEHRHLPWAGHLPTLERPEVMDQHILDHLDRLSGR